MWVKREALTVIPNSEKVHLRILESQLHAVDLTHATLLIDIRLAGVESWERISQMASISPPTP